MPWRTIYRYSLSAAAFGLCASAIWLTTRCIHRRKGPRRQDLPDLLVVFYLAALIQIIGLRLGLQAMRWLGGVPRFTPLRTTTDQWRKGPGAFIYHVCGNLIWFVPLGGIVARRRPNARWIHALLAGAGLSLAVETLQFLLGTGVPEVDDVLLNSLGALLGYRLLRRRG